MIGETMRFSARCVLGLMLVVTVACQGATPPEEPQAESSPPQQEDEATEPASTEAGEPPPTEAAEAAAFTTGDLEQMVLGEDEAPGGMKPNGQSMETARTSGEAARNAVIADDYGYELALTQAFATPSALKPGRPKVGDLGFYSLSSYAAVYDDAEGAAAHFADPAPPGDAQEDYENEPLDDGPGEQSRRATWKEKSNFGGKVAAVRLVWQRANAIFAIDGYGLKPGSIDHDALLSLAREIDSGATPGAAAPLGLPEVTDAGETLFEDSFKRQKGGWRAGQYSDGFSEYRNGSYLMGYSGDAAAVSTSDEVKKSLAKLADVRLEFDAEVTSGKGAFGGVCRYGKRGQTYVFSVTLGGDVSVGHVTAGKGGGYNALGNVSGADVGKGTHRVRLDCVGDDIVRLQLRVDDELVMDAIDRDAKLRAGAVGMLAGTTRGPVTVRFDNLAITQP